MNMSNKLKGDDYMGMTDRQFDVHLIFLIKSLKEALAESPENKRLKELIEELDAVLKRP